MTPLFLGHDIYRGSSYGEWHPLRVPRVPTVTDLARALGWLPADRFVRSPRAKPAALSAWHTPAYIDALMRTESTQTSDGATRTRHGLGTPACPVFPEMYRRPATGAGGSLLAGELLRNGGVIHHPGGGTHHGMPDRASGFCYLNDPVFAILSLRRNGAQRIAYVDIDAHHADGVEHAFTSDPDTLLISVHEEGRWPRTGALEDQGIGQTINLPVPKGLHDGEMDMIRERLILPLIERMAPDAIVLQCGSDAIEEDPLSGLSLTNASHRALVRACKPLSPRLLVLGGGGYNPWSVGRCWTLIWGELTGQDVPERLPPEAEAVLRALRWTRASRGRNPPDHWFETLADAPRRGQVRPAILHRIDALMTRDGLHVPGARFAH
ncbi:acetoin utilization protein [Jannaschia aquimarina]|uniref:Acetoin utilization protein AcuC n=1 Tax=Jannaschia aquimarina TaxID=935700 RepID=A0A0D1D2V0_9RHOB|nr:acetoin utilization protein [Jannaschia aquimarina]KIT14423.1 Acetoin utilization protein AcuC [Jannaschia aquimarina]SNT29582.1 acetoin utilization protein AcuC [Jannaschia aquimarina]